MSDRLRVLVYNSTPLGVCDFYRTWMFQPHFEALGIELRSWPARTPPRPPRPGRRLAWADREALEWADVVVFRRGEQTHHLCFDCAFATPSREEATAHARDRRHAVQTAANEFLRPLWAALETEPRLLAGRGLVYETDDDLLRIPTWNGNRRILAHERDLVEAMLRRADLVTVSTPVLAERVRAQSPRVRVIRNAVEPAWYTEATPDPDLPGEPRVLHYGNASRLAYYDVCRAAVEAVKDHHPDLWRVWLGAPDSPEHRARIAAVVDEVRDYVIGVPAFARALVRARPDIGLAPLLGDEFDRAKSELHWLEYALAGAVTVATRTMAGGPYSVIRNGVDGFLVKSKAEWYDTLLRLARSPGLRAEVAGRARERVLAEYDAARRAVEWADAFRWAAEHAGIGRLERRLVVDASAVEAVRRRSTASLGHRRRIRRWEEAAARRLVRVRASTLPAGMRSSLISVVVPVVGGDDAEARLSRSLP
ncbi:MAG TPA: glycosyltransferase, partial [Candidatus Binatia bacterium]|nr:glycosyltransferase [Candidatus Binatia bacterium]